MRPIVQRYTLLSVCSSDPADKELAVKSVSVICGGVSSAQWPNHSWSVGRHTALILYLYSVTKCTVLYYI